MVYEWKMKGVIKADANVAGEVFKELEQTVGLNAENLVNASKPADAPLHNEFEWNDAVAGQKYREQQAMYMIRTLTIVHEDSGQEEKAEPVRAYFQLKPKTNYERTETILADTEKTTALFDLAMRELLNFQRKYRKLEVFADLFAEIERLEHVTA